MTVLPTDTLGFERQNSESKYITIGSTCEKVFVCTYSAATYAPLAVKPPRALLERLPAETLWDLLAVDYVRSFPINAHNDRYVLVLTDHFSKYVEVTAVLNQSKFVFLEV